MEMKAGGGEESGKDEPVSHTDRPRPARFTNNGGKK
jgi:hypothetical protein